ncbi:MAG: DUF1003 domain-containing protein [Alphaproteobacteria bacterium]|nr:DUF1003 domain-containing protein [Alphaproteobacteria bacterium]
MTFPDLPLLDELRAAARARRKDAAAAAAAAAAMNAGVSFGDRAADAVAAVVGSWRFVLIQSSLLAAWLVWNTIGGRPFDPFPFILLNLMLSFQAAYTAPIIMMSQNRQSDVDRKRAIADFDVNTKAELEIELLHHKLDLLREQEIARLSDAVDRLSRILEGQTGPARNA